MDVIDGTWIKARLTGARGEKSLLATAMRITPDKLAKVLTGQRAVQPQEVPAVLTFFAADRAGLSEPQAPFERLADSTETAAILKALAPDAKALAAWVVGTDLPLVALRRGDIMVVELGNTAASGDLVLVTVADGDTARTELRRLFPPMLVPVSLDEGSAFSVDDPSGRVAVVASVKAVIRAPGLAQRLSAEKAS